jgi:hypothetical protein
LIANWSCSNSCNRKTAFDKNRPKSAYLVIRHPRQDKQFRNQPVATFYRRGKDLFNKSIGAAYAKDTLGSGSAWDVAFSPDWTNAFSSFPTGRIS